jgi:hypothetical protein
MTEVFVFGSNLAGRHGAGSAREAVLYYGARYGVGVGRQGNSYAIPTKNQCLKRLELEEIADHVKTFLQYAWTHPNDTFKVVAIGCGLAGFHPKQIGPLFKGAPINVQLPAVFERWV